MQQLKLEIFADYFQFYLQDEAANGDLSDSWGPEAVDRLLAVAPGTVGVGTVCNVMVPVLVEILASEPESDVDKWDHVTECGLDVPTGSIVIAGCTDYFPEATRMKVAPGSYCVRVSYGTLSSLPENGLKGKDHYRVQLWPGPYGEPRVLKRRAA